MEKTNHLLATEGNEEQSVSLVARHRSAARAKRIKSAIEGYLYLAPTLVVLIVFVFVPVITSFAISLNRTAPFGNRTIFVGLGNYTRLLSDPD